jgi:glycosyltransferase involved in cell wall biosynthesis
MGNAQSKPLSAADALRVTYVGHVAQLSGGEIALSRLIEALDEVDAHVILAESGPLVARLLASGATVEVLPMRERTRGLRKDRVGATRLPLAAILDTAIYTLRLARRLRAIRPDLVHTNTLKAGVYGSIAARLVGIPVVWHVRDRIERGYLKRSTAIVLRALISTLPSGVLVNSKATGSTLWSTSRPKRVVYSLVRTPTGLPFTSNDEGYRDPFVVGMVGRLAPWKGQHVFLEAFARAFPDGSEVAAVVGGAMFGNAETRYGDELRGTARSRGIVGRVRFRGFRDDVWSELSNMDVFVHASISPEPFGQVIVEAMAAGVPVIAASGGGASEIVTDGFDGLLYPAGDIDALAARMRQLRDDPALGASLRTNALTTVERFSAAAAVSSVMGLYEQLHGAR